jgi:hypothetical protein
MGDVDLPAATVLRPDHPSDEEVWIYSASYDQTVAFLRKQFATGRRYDMQGATWWRGVPPCYNSKYDYNTMSPGHESPPKGWVLDDSTEWMWADGSMTLEIQVWKPGNRITTNGEPWITINYSPTEQSALGGCNRS